MDKPHPDAVRVDDDRFLLYDAGWAASPSASVPPAELIVGGWMVDASGETGPFQPNPHYAPRDKSTPTDPINEILRSIAAGEPLFDQLVATLAHSVVHLASTDRTPVVATAPDGSQCVLVATAYLHQRCRPDATWGPELGGKLPLVVPAELDILLNPGHPAQFQLRTDALWGMWPRKSTSAKGREPMKGHYVFVAGKGLFEAGGAELETVALLGEHRDEVHARWSPSCAIDSWRKGEDQEPTGPWSDRLKRSGAYENVRLDYDTADRVAFIEAHEPETAINVDDSDWLYPMWRHHTEVLAELGEHGFHDPEEGLENLTFHDQGLVLWCPSIYDDDEDDPLDEDDESYGVRAIAIFAPGYYGSSREPTKS